MRKKSTFHIILALLIFIPVAMFAAVFDNVIAGLLFMVAIILFIGIELIYYVLGKL
jgi:hypothetical protein